MVLFKIQPLLEEYQISDILSMGCLAIQLYKSDFSMYALVNLIVDTKLSKQLVDWS